MRALLLAWFLLLCKPSLQEPLSADIQKLLADLMPSYDSRVLPIVEAGVPVNVSVSFTLLNLELKYRSATLGLWGRFQWTDPRLSWDPAMYGGVKDIRLSPDQLWTPDIIPYNTLPSPRVDWLSPTLVVVKHDGSLLWVPTTSLVVSSGMSPERDAVDCRVLIGSWTHPSGQLDLIPSSEKVDNSSYYERDREWEVRRASLVRNALRYRGEDRGPYRGEEYIAVRIDLWMQKPARPVMQWPDYSATAGSMSTSPNLPMALLVTIIGWFIKTFRG